MQRFQDRTIVVTGGGGGIGGATYRRFAQEGARVAVFDLSLAAATKVSEAIRDSGGVAEAIRCDITQRTEVAAALAASDDAAYVTGQVLSVSGGLTMNG